MSVIRGNSFYITVDGHAWSTAESNAINLGGNYVCQWHMNIIYATNKPLNEEEIKYRSV